MPLIFSSETCVAISKWKDYMKYYSFKCLHIVVFLWMNTPVWVIYLRVTLLVEQAIKACNKEGMEWGKKEKSLNQRESAQSSECEGNQITQLSNHEMTPPSWITCYTACSGWVWTPCDAWCPSAGVTFSKNNFLSRNHQSRAPRVMGICPGNRSPEPSSAVQQHVGLVLLQTHYNRHSRPVYI